MFDSPKEIWPMSQVPPENVGDSHKVPSKNVGVSHKVPGKNVGAREQDAGAGRPFGLAALARGRWLARANGSFSSLVSRNCHSFATVSRSLVALADVRGALRLRGRMLVRVRDSRKRMVA